MQRMNELHNSSDSAAFSSGACTGRPHCCSHRYGNAGTYNSCCAQTWAWHKSETPEDIDKMWVWRPEGADSVHPSRFDALKDEEQARLGPRTPALWRRTLVSDLQGRGPSYVMHVYA